MDVAKSPAPISKVDERVMSDVESGPAGVAINMVKASLVCQDARILSAPQIPRSSEVTTLSSTTRHTVKMPVRPYPALSSLRKY